MALGAITGGLSLVGGLFGGGPRAPRMSCEQKELMMSQANLNNAMADMMRQGGQGVGACCNSMFGPRCPACGGPLANRGMNGYCGDGGLQQYGGYNSLNPAFGNDFGFGFGGGPFFQPPGVGASFSLGVSMRL